MSPSFRDGVWRGIPVLEFMDGSVPRAALTLRFDDPRPQDRVLCELQGLGPTLSLRQVHGDRILTEEAIEQGGVEGDGIFIQRAGVTSILQFADCYPVFFFGGVANPWCLSLHSGFAGTILNIVGAAAKFLRTLGKDDLSSVMAWIGPGIGCCCYSRCLDDRRTIKAMNKLDSHRYRIDSRMDMVYFDLMGVIKDQITAIGIPDKNIAVAGGCTACDDLRCFSYRKGDVKARMVLFSRIDHAIFVGKR